MKRTRKKFAGLTLLGRSESALPASPSQAQLEIFPNPQPKRDYWIHLDCPDFTSLCPVTGQPDFARITIDYIPAKACLETKALKFYLASFRNEPAFNEAVINRILDDLVKACRPRVLRIEGRFSPRGGLGLAVVAEHPRTGAAASAPEILATPMKAVVLLSGGMDSTAALYDARARHEIAGAVSFDYGSKHNAREIPFAKWHCKKLKIPHQVIALDFVPELFQSALLKSGGKIPDGHYEEETMKQTVVPFRNGIMLAIAAGYAESIGAQDLVIAAHAGDHAIYPDCREAFMQAMAEALRLGTYANIELLRPFIKFTKAQIAARGHELGVDFSETWSCYKGGKTHCGTCGTCVERREAFINSRLPDPTAYASTAPLPKKPKTSLKNS